jgi:hypothetical protein
MKQRSKSLLCYICILGIVALGLKTYLESEIHNLKCVISSVDGKRYCVRDRKNVHKYANLLAHVTTTCSELVLYMKNNYSDDERTVRLVNGFNPNKISETLPTSELTAYSENKGEKLAFCLTTTKTGKTPIDIHTLTFVAIHELAHIMTKTIGHGQEFWENFKYLLEKAKEGNIYTTTNYKNKPASYCGMKLEDNPYYDLI